MGSLLLRDDRLMAACERFEGVNAVHRWHIVSHRLETDDVLVQPAQHGTIERLPAGLHVSLRP